LSTIAIFATSGVVSSVVAERLLAQSSQMNQKFVRIPVLGSNKYHSFNSTIEQIITSPVFANFKYILLMEDDIIPPYDGLHRLFESIKNFDVVSGLVWEKGEEGKPQIFGNPKYIPGSYTHVGPENETVQPCLGVSTKYTLFKLSIFRDEKVPKPWFRIIPNHETGKKSQIPDMYFFDNIHKLGYTVAVDTRIKVGHAEINSDIVW
jgi:hypothetical protein